MEDIEIIVVEDSSTDNSLEILENLQNEDLRISIIKNKVNKGALYSKCIGILKAMGQYLLILDSDDLIINDEILNICYRNSEKIIDIIEFSGFFSSKELLEKNEEFIIPYYLKFKKNNKIITQPKLSNFIYQMENNTIIRLIDGFICGKLMKNEALKKALNLLGNWIFKEKVNYGDDRIVNFALFKVSKSFKFIEEYGFIYYNNPSSITHTIKTNERCHDELINIMSIFNITKYSSDLKIVIFELISRWNSTIYPGLDKKNKHYAKILIKQILENKYITKDDKNKVKLLLKDLS